MKKFLEFFICIVFLWVIVCGQEASKPKSGPPKPQIPASKPKSGPPQPQMPASKPTSTQPMPKTPPKIDFGKCPQLKLTEAEEKKRASLHEFCLKSHPIPSELNENTVREHSKKMTECSLRKEGWFDKNGKYRFGRTKSRIVSKKLPKALETKLIGHIPKCQSEAEKKFPQKQEHIDSIQYFQACMDFQTTETCGIKLIPDEQN